MRADACQNPRVEPQAVDGRALGDDLAQLHVVFLAATFLVGALGVCVVHVATPVLFDARDVVELAFAVAQDQPEQLPEGVLAAQLLEPVQDVVHRLGERKPRFHLCRQKPHLVARHVEAFVRADETRIESGLREFGRVGPAFERAFMALGAAVAYERCLVGSLAPLLFVVGARAPRRRSSRWTCAYQTLCVCNASESP